ncbi:NOP protein chaperone 1 [Cynoglossus semilaevis]|uniref:NOP protein chaperone 1 n=1 Tax=Cynoglossus semilaevis TaxID=244447 RepID=A0A3P8UNU6_CYNSE|nr:uncharacterized protein C12orf45 homolog [Cynoglossus semilaevis]
MEPSRGKTCSQALLSCGNEDLGEKFLLKPKTGSTLQTERLPRSSVLDRLQTFLPQISKANEELEQQKEMAPPGHFDIECVDQAQKIIEMDIALVELSSSNEEADNEVIWEDSEEDSDLDDYVPEVTEENLKIPGSGVGKKVAGIQVLDNPEKVDISAPATCGKK